MLCRSPVIVAVSENPDFETPEWCIRVTVWPTTRREPRSPHRGSRAPRPSACRDTRSTRPAYCTRRPLNAMGAARNNVSSAGQSNPSPTNGRWRRPKSGVASTTASTRRRRAETCLMAVSGQMPARSSRSMRVTLRECAFRRALHCSVNLAWLSQRSATVRRSVSNATAAS